MTRPRVVIVGSGLGGSLLANALLATHDVTVIERDPLERYAQPPMVDLGRPAAMDHHFVSGLGGSTQLWHNGLIEIDASIFDRHWPIPKTELAGYYDQAFELLSKVAASTVRKGIGQLEQRCRAAGLDADRLIGLFYPRWPANVWDSLGLGRQVNLIRGEVTGFETEPNGRIGAVVVTDASGAHAINGDHFVLCAGGLGTPVLLQQLAQTWPLPSLQQAGRHYEDHPMTFVGELEVDAPLYRLWNYSAPGTSGNLRMLLVNVQDGLEVSFQLRPAATFHRASRRQRVSTVLNDLRRQMWNPAHYLKLFTHWDDVLDILSFKFGIRLPTRRYTVMMMAQMPTSAERSIWGEPQPEGLGTIVMRRWVLDDAYLGTLQSAVDAFVERLGTVVKSARIFPDWPATLHTGAHHSGTARMAASAEEGVCDADGRVHGTPNLWVCDGSLIPASGIANTGLTIGALALRLADTLRRHGA